MEISNKSIQVLQKSLDYIWKKQGVISENIANATTPGYKAKYVTFEEALQRNLKNAKSGKEISKAVENARIEVKTSKDVALSADGNNVDLDAEYVELARAQLQYEYLINAVNDQLTRIRTVLQR